MLKRTLVSVLSIWLYVLGLNAQSVAKPPVDSLSIQSILSRASSINSVTSLLIQKDGELLAERYFGRLDKNETTNIKSASKSIISLLVGIAIDRGDIESVDQPIAQYFEEYFKEHPNPQKEKITIKDLLTMRSGLETTSFHNYGRWVVSENWVEFALDQPMEATPGGDMVYSTGTSHLLSVILTRATGMSTKGFAEENLFEPLDIQVGGWDLDPQGYYMGGNNMALSPASMLKIGQMVLNGGTYEGQRILPEQWLKDSFQVYTRSNYNPYDYGYMWWKKPVGKFKVHFAWGYGGQYIFIVPSLDAVIVLTGNLQDASQSRSYKEPVFSLLREAILPFLEKQEAPKY